jgi:TP901 family phage tail tape measure protein
MNLNSVLRITAKVTGISAFTKVDRALKKTEKAAREAEKGIKKMLDSRLFRTAAVAAAGFSAAIALSTKAAIDFESSMAEVRKVVDGLESPEAFREISNEILELSSRMPIAAEGFAEIYAAAGQAGIARDDLEAFAEQVGQVSVAFDMTAADAGESMAKIMTALSLTTDEMGLLADAMNHISNNSAASAADLVDFQKRAGAVGKSAGLTAEQTAAIGGAMIAAGSDSNVAATSFRKVINALAAGPSATDRQVDALYRLGFAMDDAVANEQEYTDAVKQESENRIAVARNETNELAKELNRRFRDQLTTIRDNLDDESEAYEEKLQDRADAQIEALQRQQRAETDAARARAEELGKSSTQEVYAIEDSYEARIDAIRDTLQDELKERRRADRDRLTQIQDDLNDRKELELRGLESNFEEFKKKEEQLMQERIDEIKAQAKAGATSVAEALAKGLQQDAVGTITEVFDLIRELPKEAQLSTIKDIFGEEARAIQPLIANSELLANSLNLVADSSKFAGSTTEEFLVRASTTAAELQDARNAIDRLSIVFGKTLAPALETVIVALTPLIEGFADFVEKNPVIAGGVAVLGGAFAGLVAILPALGGLVQVLGFLGKQGVTFGALAAKIGAVGKAVAGVLALFLGPLGWAALIGVAIGTLYTFRDEIANVFKVIGEEIGYAFEFIGELLKEPFDAFSNWYQENFVQPYLDANKVLTDKFNKIWNAIQEFIQNPFELALAWINENFVQPAVELIEGLKTSIKETWEGITEFFTAPIEAAFTYITDLAKNVLNGIVGVINSAIGLINNAISGANKLPGVNIPLVPEIPAFANGGMVNGAQLAIVGEAGPEYIVPAGKAQGFAQNILAGVRGPAAIPAYAEGGYVGPVNITTGPVMQQDGTNYVTMAQFEAGVRDVAAAITRNSRSYGSRRYAGIS